MTRRLPSLLVALGAAAHRLFERRAGLGLPLQPYLGKRGADGFWTGTLAAWIACTSRPASWKTSAAIGSANGAAAATIAIHYADWEWRWLGPLPVLTEAEGLPPQSLAAYNVVLLGWGLACCSAFARGMTGPQRLLAVANGIGGFIPARVLARRHMRWLDEQRGQPGITDSSA